MAKIETEFDFPTRYDWDLWLDGRTWRLTRPEDFDVSVAVFRSQAYRAALRRRGILETSIEGDDLVLRFQKSEKNLNPLSP